MSRLHIHQKIDAGRRLFWRVCAVCACLLTLPLSVSAAPSGEDAAARILAWKGVAATTGPLAATAGRGNADWYAAALARQPAPPDGAPYLDALRVYLASAPPLTPTDRLRISLALAAWGEPGDFAADTLAMPADTLAARIFALRLANALEQPPGTRPAELLASQLPDGGWALRGDAADPDLTAMAVQSLAPHAADPAVAAALDGALTCLAAMQQPGGGYLSWGTPACESTAQVLLALCACGVDPHTDRRFMRNDHTLVDVLLAYSTPEGSFAHTPGGAPDDTATVQALTALLALRDLPDPPVAASTTAATSTSTPPAAAQKPHTFPLKPLLAAALLLLAGSAILTLRLTRRLRRTTLLLTALLTAAALLTLPLLSLQTPDEYAAPPPPGDAIGAATLTIRCDAALGRVPAALALPDNGVLLPPTEVAVFPGDTAFSVLERAARTGHIPLDFSGDLAANCYVRAIAHLREFDAGPTAGWMFRINGAFSSSGAAATAVRPGDRLEWLYTLDFGRDIT